MQPANYAIGSVPYPVLKTLLCASGPGLPANFYAPCRSFWTKAVALDFKAPRA
jgi:hypothetical protein